jgi:hypothetical protein
LEAGLTHDIRDILQNHPYTIAAVIGAAAAVCAGIAALNPLAGAACGLVVADVVLNASIVADTINTAPDGVGVLFKATNPIGLAVGVPATVVSSRQLKPGEC